MNAFFSSLAAVAAGGFLGGVSRWALSRVPGGLTGTWVANVLGCAALGMCVASPSIWVTFVGAGFAGALSTLSTLSKELGALLKAQRSRAAWSYFFVTITGGTVAALAGLSIAYWL
ncbi:fluoride efflux transporter FluC [Corynebacterium liangguodongii]|uniref:Fluoride-specific ion channel FluC n=1 Tax=Corynebacterium liangguodongii TaxID=2079535 RepID=A0A2S0WFN6_9CORY|nr:CrcB family protein [Corynebacterium liangguodongii]AWB84597.1 camphor resistance protein CrcB [Corynebacterium liangguodongii]PWB98817.1 camphor resistance protein CrcB [Corynebacterium liangguodongii]